MNKNYVEILTKLKADIQVQLKLLEPYDQDNRERNRVVECLQSTCLYICWEIMDSTGTNNAQWTDEDFAQIENDINDRFEE